MEPRLFTVQNIDCHKLAKDPETGQTMYFTDKMEAKAFRDALNGGLYSEVTPHWSLAKGPDHRKA